MLTERDFRPSLTEPSPEQRPKAWLTANETLNLGEASRLYAFRGHDLIEHAATGRLRTWASRLVVGETAWGGGEITSKFWQACRESKVRDWRSGDFEIAVEGRFVVRAQHVKFYVGDLKALFPGAFAAQRKLRPKRVSLKAEVTGDTARARGKGGRKLSPSWPQWVAEVVALVHETGIPDGEGVSGVDVMLKVVAERLAARGYEGPARTTSQETMRAVLLRLRHPGD